MTKEEEFDWLCRLRSEIYVFMPKEWLIPMNNALDMAIKDLKQEPKWIPVSERLPENRNQEVLISLEWGIDIGRYSDGEWHSEWINHFDDGNVLAWMPLPKPYEPQESEGEGMTNEQAKSELMQIYMSLSEEKKKALDVAFQAMEQAIPEMYYPQVDGITPTVVAQADGEKNCFNCKWYPDNDITKGFDEVCHKCSNSDKWEGLIKRVPWEDIAPPPKIPEAQADGEYILKKDVMGCIGQTSVHSELARKLRKLPSVAIPSAEPREVLYSGDGYADGEMVYDMAECMNCGREFEYDDETWGCNFCPDCGQALKWEGEQE